MANAGDRKSLLGGCGGQEGPGSAEEDAFQFPVPEPVQQIPAEGDGAAAAAGASGMDVLDRVVKDQSAAVRQFAAQGEVIPFPQFQKGLFPDLPQITGDDQIEVIRPSAHVVHMGLYGLECRRGDCQV